MSAKMMGEVYGLDLPHNKQSILLAMADHADHDGNNIRPSIGHIAWKTGYQEKQVGRIIRDLRNDGLLVLRAEGKGRPATYSIDISKGVKKAEWKEVRKTKHETKKVSGKATQIGHLDVPPSDLQSTVKMSYPDRTSESPTQIGHLDVPPSTDIQMSHESSVEPSLQPSDNRPNTFSDAIAPDFVHDPFEDFVAETMPEALEPLAAAEEAAVPDEQPSVDLSKFGQGTTINGKRVLQEAVKVAFDILPSAFNGRVGNFLTGRIPITDISNPPKWERFQITHEPMTPAEIIGLRLWREDMYPSLDEQKITLKPEDLRDWVDHFHGHRLRKAAARTGQRELAKILGVSPDRLHESGWYLLEEPEPVPAGDNDPNRIITQEEADELGELLEQVYAGMRA